MQINENVRGRGRLHRPADLPAGERHADGAADDDRRVQARLGAPDHRGAALLRLRAARIARCRPRCRSRPSSWPTCSTRPARSRVLALDLHAGQIQGFFNIPVDHLFAAPAVMIDYLDEEGPAATRSSSRPTRAAWSAPGPSPSGSTRGLAIIDKRRDGPNVGRVHAPHRRRQGQGRGGHRRHDRHRGHPGPGRRRAQARGRPAHPRLRRARRAVRARHRAHQGVAHRRSHRHQLDSAAARTSRLPQDHAFSRSRRCSAEAIRRIHDEESVSTLFV